MSILIIGLGSIGRRHLRNLLSLEYADISVVSRLGILPDEFSALPVYLSIADAFSSHSFDTAFICTPTSWHICNLEELLTNKVTNIYLEKPVSDTYDKIDHILQLASSYKNKIVVGYDLHFDLGLQKVCELIQDNVIGAIVSVDAIAGQHLSQWRPYEDHRKGISAKKETGGGVMLDLIHEFDYLSWLLGDVYSVACLSANSGELEIETEEVAEVLLKFSGGTIGTVHLDYFQQSLIRNCLFTGTKGSIFLDLANKKVTWVNENGDQADFNYTGFERNDRFKAIVKTFLENDNDDRRLTSLQDGLKSLQIVLAAKKSASQNCFIKLSEFTA